MITPSVPQPKIPGATKRDLQSIIKKADADFVEQITGDWGSQRDNISNYYKALIRNTPVDVDTDGKKTNWMLIAVLVVVAVGVGLVTIKLVKRR